MRRHAASASQEPAASETSTTRLERLPTTDLASACHAAAAARVSCKADPEARPIRTRARTCAVRSAVAGLAAILAVAASSISRPTATSHDSPASLSPGCSRARAIRNVTAPNPNRVRTLNHAVNASTKRVPRADMPARRSSAAARIAPGAVAAPALMSRHASPQCWPAPCSARPAGRYALPAARPRGAEPRRARDPRVAGRTRPMATDARAGNRAGAAGADDQSCLLLRCSRLGDASAPRQEGPS